MTEQTGERANVRVFGIRRVKGERGGRVACLVKV